jgi:hypothetical protein
MQHHWRLRRQTHPCPDGQRRWNTAYQLLVQWTTPSEPLLTPVAASTSLSEIVDQEEDHAHCSVSSCLDPATSPTPDQ